MNNNEDNLVLQLKFKKRNAKQLSYVKSRNNNINKELPRDTIADI